ncbi:DNA primase [Palleronia sp. KMU-117]|uniref:DNA primase n=1 Tax=Palleronia sp. KMU-117 TaxID=3434108 RepID=UPI003D763EC4
MSLPPGFLDELRTRTSLSQVVGRKVVWDARKSNRGKGDLWAPCPFHQEKSASFHVDDRKGYYYCFGCHAKGDAISFVRETENLGFMEAVEVLAREAGMPMPARDPKAQEKSDRRADLAEVMEQAVRHYRLQLRTAAAAEARDYLARRSLSEAALDRWEIGFAPPGWQGLWEHLRGKGVAADLILGAGLARSSDRGKEPYDTFRNRIMFPIRDARGRAIAFGGRAMDPADTAKYLNSPETELFDKGRSLFNHGPAREAAGKGQPLIVAEGYMDVIALTEAGFTATVAPLGTAVTEDQLRLLWRIDPEPVVALDGDRAGLNAALRLIDLALPMLEAGQSLRFAILPDGQDPDDLIRAGGAAAMQRCLDAAVPMVTLLWRRETEGKVFDSPERRAGLDKSLREAIRRIKDPSVRSHYGAEVNRLRQDLFAPQRVPRFKGPRGFGRDAPRTPTPAAKASALATADASWEDQLREAVILAMLVTHPGLIPDFVDELERMEPLTQDHARVLSALLSSPEPTRDEIDRLAGADALEKLFTLRHVQISPGVRNADDSALAMACVREELAKLAARRGAEREIEEAAHDLQALADEGVTWRLSQAAEARNSAGRITAGEETDFERAPNGLRLSKEDRDRAKAVFGQIDFGRGGRKRP